MSQHRLSPLEEALKNPLPGVKKQLAQEYRRLPDERIDMAARQALDELADARVKDFVPVIAWRRARKRLRQAS
jgi:hypothetical protein